MAPSTLLDPPAPARPGSGSGRFGDQENGRGDDGGDRWHSQDPGDLPISNGRLAMVQVLCASTMLFMAMISAFVVLRGSAREWPPAGSPPLPTGLWVNTILVAASSAALVVAHVAQRRRNAAVCRMGLLLATLGALSFLFRQSWVWRGLLHDGFVPAVNNQAALYYLLTLAHFAHVLAGFVLLLRITLRVRRVVDGAGLARLSASFDVAAMFWHFVGVLWVVIWLLITS